MWALKRRSWAMEPMNLSEPERLSWLIESRSKIQRLSLDILVLLEMRQITDSGDVMVRTAAGLLVGSAFSLWRAVFLSHPSQKWEDNLEAAKKYLRRVLRDNQISFEDDKELRKWAFGYYINNVRYRMLRLCDEMPELENKFRSAGVWDYFQQYRQLNLRETSEVWTRCYESLEISVACLKARLEAA
jgi:hypothetical protein